MTESSSAPSPRDGPRPATMADVAERVGVSRQLVGLVFQNAAGVGADTRERILEAARVMGYSPNTAARALRAGSTKYIGVIFDPAHSAPVEIIEWLYAYAHESGYQLVVSALTPIRDESEAITEIVGHRCEALILIAPRSSPELLRRVAGQISIVVIGRGIPDSEFDLVRSQGDSGIESVVVHLAGLGHTDIVYVHGVDMLDGALRLSGYRTAAQRLALTEQILEVRGDYTEECGARAARILLAREVLPTAIVCSNDQAALGLSHTLAAAEVCIPADVSITGFDDSRVARLSFMNLTTVRQDPREVGEAAIAAAISRITGTRVTGTEVFTSARLVVRGSTAVPSRPPASF
ncbi:LacI family DNA-binding transcriptional regulator [Cryobacterium sp. M91]|uniref:LacI family DNA-binding transcriptional regulator n=1 Tax=Cryobacterium sp. M91 TaxID=2048294 RepID=UPI001304E544|nr:LacI family DNA-binding transcriptional regulator [Cryobacterium sp. M91]